MTETKPISQSQRTPIIDILRGWALFSVALMNYSTIFSWNNHSKEYKPDIITQSIQTISETTFESKGWTLLAILFGYGFSVLLKNISKSGQNQYKFFTNRMLWLFVFAFFNSIFFGGDILNDYALMGLILLLFYKLSPKSLLIIAIIILVLTPALQSYLGRNHLLFTPKYRDEFYELYNRGTFLDNIKANLSMRYKWMLRLSYSLIMHLIQLACFLLGVASERIDFSKKLNLNSRAILKKIFWISLIAAVLVFVLQTLIEKNEWNFNNYYNLYYPKVLSIMLLSTSIMCWLYFSNKLKRLFNALQTIGKMTLTNYILQNVISFILFICVRPEWALQWYLFTGVVIYILQIFYSKWWLSNYNFGFAEWLWRCLSYRKWFSLHRHK